MGPVTGRSAHRNAQGTDPLEQDQRCVKEPVESSRKQLATGRRTENTFSCYLTYLDLVIGYLGTSFWAASLILWVVGWI